MEGEPFTPMSHPDGSWNWEALERHYAGELSPEEIREIFAEPPAEETRDLVPFPQLDDAPFLEWLITWELPQRPRTLYHPYIIWRLGKIQEQAPATYAVFKMTLRTL